MWGVLSVLRVALFLSGAVFESLGGKWWWGQFWLLKFCLFAGDLLWETVAKKRIGQPMFKSGFFKGTWNEDESHIGPIPPDTAD